MSQPPLVSLITVNYGQAKLTCDLLDSTRRLTYPNFEVIVVDNGSKEDPTEQIKQGNYPNVTVIVSPQNLGFAGGNNLALPHAKGEYLFFLNNDTEVTPDLLERLLEPFQNPAVGVVCPKIRFFDAPNVIQYAGYLPLNTFTGRTWAIGEQEEDRGQHETPGATFFAHGAAMMVSRAVLEKVGPMFEGFFLYYEELDWAMRIRRAGFEIYYQPTALIYHKESMSVGKASPLKLYYYYRNRLLFMRRNVAGLPLAFFSVYYFLIALPKAALKHALNGEKANLNAMKQAIRWHFTPPANRPADVAMPALLNKA